jgi:hypothetical protein
MTNFKKLGKIMAEELKKQKKKSSKVSNEEMFEMRAIFGKSKKIVNVLTGEITYT